MAIADTVSTLVKICGLTRSTDAHNAAEAGADFLGFIHFEKSPRHLSLDAAKELASRLPNGPKRVGVFVDASDAVIQDFVDALTLDAIQLHGSESPARVRDIKTMTKKLLIKVIKVANEQDVALAKAYGDVADMFLFDTKPLPGDSLPGGLGRAFPWQYLRNYKLSQPSLVAGGLSAHTVDEALSQSSVQGADVSSGVEEKPGIKSHTQIRDFINAAKSVRA